MRSLDLADLTNEQMPTGIWAAALLHALARDEAAGRRTQRLTETKHGHVEPLPGASYKR